MDIFPSKDEKERLISLLKGLPFENLVFSDYFEKNSSKRHNISKDELREVYPQFKKIIEVTIRDSKSGKKYCFVYKINRRLTYYIIFRLDKKPKEIFNAYRYRGDIEKRLAKKYLGPWF